MNTKKDSQSANVARLRLVKERWVSPMGPLFIVTDEQGKLRALEFGDYEPRLHRLLQTYYHDYELREGEAPAALKNALTAYFDGDLKALTSLETVTAGTAFQEEVWKALRKIPAGTTLSYGQLAAALGRVGASRAVGAANGANPIPIVVPCHRVIGADGSLTGFGGGLDHKRWLLDHEARHAEKSGKKPQTELAF